MSAIGKGVCVFCLSAVDHEEPPPAPQEAPASEPSDCTGDAFGQVPPLTHAAKFDEKTSGEPSGTKNGTSKTVAVAVEDYYEIAEAHEVGFEDVGPSCDSDG